MAASEESMATPLSLTPDEKVRYRRQLILPEIGAHGQQRLKRATVMIAGLGGLGSISAFYMAAAGVGHLKIVDADRVAGHDLNRQILHATADIGRLKTASALSRLGALNPLCHIEAISARIEDQSIGPMIEGCDLVIDGLDTLDARRALNRAALKAGIPYIFGGVNGFDGMAATFIPGRSACLECIFPETIESTPEETGVIGPAAGVVASLQCIEAVKLLVGKGADLAGVLMHFHGLGMRFKKVAVDRNPDCPVCAPK
jgi:molybdopterin/thiamine biosynthesis adenylyltransferase